MAGGGDLFGVHKAEVHQNFQQIIVFFSHGSPGWFASHTACRIKASGAGRIVNKLSARAAGKNRRRNLARRVRGKRGRGAGRKVTVIGLLKRADKVFVQIVPNRSKKELLRTVHGQVKGATTIHTDGCKAHDGLE
jgi:hypothetical protein